jgi:hypothetical protein
MAKLEIAESVGAALIGSYGEELHPEEARIKIFAKVSWKYWSNAFCKLIS